MKKYTIKIGLVLLFALAVWLVASCGTTKKCTQEVDDCCASVEY